MKSMKIAKILLIIITLILVTIPICIIMETKADAGATQETIESYDGDYVFFVIEDSKTPLAFAPTENSSGNGMIIWVIAMTTIAIIFATYSIWYFNTKNTISVVADGLPVYAKSELMQKGSFFHPIRSKLACDEAVYSAANQYFDSRFDI